MAGIKNIRDLYKKVGEKGLREVLEKEIRVTEKFDAYRFAFEKNPHNYKIYFYGKNGKTPLSKIDRTVNDLYEAAIAHIENLPADIKRAIPVRHRFGFSWFPNNAPLSTSYDRKPKKGLILTDITIRNRDKDVTRDVKESQIFERFASVFGVEPNKPVFEGQLSTDTVNSLIEMAKNDYTMKSFSLNESQVTTKGILSQGNQSIEALVFESEDLLFKISDVTNEERKLEKRGHLFDILLLDICEHLGHINISNIKAASVHPDEAYIEVVSEVFNDFVEKKGKDFLESGLQRPKFLEKSGIFNKAWIRNPKTSTLIESNVKYEYLFTVFLTNLRKPKYASGLLSEAVVNSFNSRIEEISKIVSDDYSFLEFNTILREHEEKTPDIVKEAKEPDIARSLIVLHTFFNSDKEAKKKEAVEAVLCNCAMPTNQLISECEAIFKRNGKRMILFHDLTNDHLRMDETTIEKMVSRLVENRSDLFIGYHILKVPTLTHLLKKCGEFHPEKINCLPHKKAVLELERSGYIAAHGGNYTPFGIESLSSRVYKDCQAALEAEDQTAFKKCTPDSVHPYWSEIKSAFDKQHYR